MSSLEDQLTAAINGKLAVDVITLETVAYCEYVTTPEFVDFGVSVPLPELDEDTQSDGDEG